MPASASSSEALSESRCNDKYVYPFATCPDGSNSNFDVLLDKSHFVNNDNGILLYFTVSRSAAVIGLVITIVTANCERSEFTRPRSPSISHSRCTRAGHDCVPVDHRRCVHVGNRHCRRDVCPTCRHPIRLHDCEIKLSWRACWIRYVSAALVCGSSQLTYLPNRGRWSVPCSLPRPMWGFDTSSRSRERTALMYQHLSSDIGS
jgi:hypothetical protein